MPYPQLNGGTVAYMPSFTPTIQVETLATLSLPGVIDADNLDSVNEYFTSNVTTAPFHVIPLVDLLGQPLLVMQSPQNGSSQLIVNAAGAYNAIGGTGAGSDTIFQLKCIAVAQDSVDLLVMPSMSATSNTFACYFGVEGSQKFQVTNNAGASLSVLLNGASIGTPGAGGCAVRIRCQSATDKSATILQYGVSLASYAVPALTTAVMLPYTGAFLAYLALAPFTGSTFYFSGGGGGTGKLLWQLNG